MVTRCVMSRNLLDSLTLERRSSERFRPLYWKCTESLTINRFDRGQCNDSAHLAHRSPYVTVKQKGVGVSAVKLVYL